MKVINITLINCNKRQICQLIKGKNKVFKSNMQRSITTQTEATVYCSHYPKKMTMKHDHKLIWTTFNMIQLGIHNTKFKTPIIAINLVNLNTIQIVQWLSTTQYFISNLHWTMFFKIFSIKISTKVGIKDSFMSNNNVQIMLRKNNNQEVFQNTNNLL